MSDEHPWTTGDAAAHGEVTPERIRQLDGQLRPWRDPSSNQRRYDPSIVRAYFAGRKQVRP